MSIRLFLSLPNTTPERYIHFTTLARFVNEKFPTELVSFPVRCRMSGGGRRQRATLGHLHRLRCLAQTVCMPVEPIPLRYSFLRASSAGNCP